MSSAQRGAESGWADRSGLGTATAPEQIADRILTAVAVGVLTPGERLPTERDLAAQLGVARNTARHALARLQALGVVEVRRGRAGGAFVLAVDPASPEASAVLRRLRPLFEEVKLLLDYRSLIEEQVARTAAMRRRRSDIQAMKAALSRYGAACDAASSRAADHELHGALATATANPHLARLSQELVVAVNLGFTADPYSAELHRRALHQHRELVSAVAAGDAETAAATAHEHFQATTVEPWRAAFDQRPASRRSANNSHTSNNTSDNADSNPAVVSRRASKLAVGPPTRNR